MDTRFSVIEVLRIAEEVDHKAARFYLRATERFADRERRNVYYHLASWHAKRQQAWARIRREHSEKTGELGAFDPDNFVLSNPQVMASLTGFGADSSSQRRLTGHESKEQMIHDAIRRAEGVVIFYCGLKEFVSDPAGRMMIDNMISEEDRHIRQLTRSLDRMSPPAGHFEDTASYRPDSRLRSPV